MKKAIYTALTIFLIALPGGKARSAPVAEPSISNPINSGNWQNFVDPDLYRKNPDFTVPRS